MWILVEFIWNGRLKTWFLSQKNSSLTKKKNFFWFNVKLLSNFLELVFDDWMWVCTLRTYTTKYIIINKSTIYEFIAVHLNLQCFSVIGKVEINQNANKDHLLFVHFGSNCFECLPRNRYLNFFKIILSKSIILLSSFFK